MSTPEDIARAQEEATLKGVAARAAGTPPAEPAPEPAHPVNRAQFRIGWEKERFELRKSGMNEYEIDQIIAEQMGVEIPPLPVVSPNCQHGNAPGACGPCIESSLHASPHMAEFRDAVTRIADRVIPIAVAPPVSPIEMTDEEMLAAVRAVRAAKERVEAAKEASRAALNEEAEAYQALEVARARVAGGVAYLTR